MSALAPAEAQGSSQSKITTGDTGQFKALVDLIGNDGFAMLFQSVKQYRQAVLEAAREGDSHQAGQQEPQP